MDRIQNSRVLSTRSDAEYKVSCGYILHPLRVFFYIKMQKVITRGPRVGRCNICGKLGNLTEDHVPPKGSITPEKVGVRSLVQTMKAVDSRIGQLFQNGVKFRTLCSTCNNVKLEIGRAHV